MAKEWTADDVSSLMRGYQGACVLAAAADLDLFDRLAGAPFTADEAAKKLSADLRAITALLDAVTAIELLEKDDGRYTVPPRVAPLLTAKGSHSILAMAQHQANCLRRWAQLGKVVKTGTPAAREPSIRGEKADYEAFIEAMDNISGPLASRTIADLHLPAFKHVLDVGGASGTWTIALLRARPEATATIFDLPQVIPQAQRRIEAAGLSDRVDFVAGNFETDPLPAGTELVWLSAIIHQNSRQQNRDLFASIRKALVPGGHILIRDIVMDESRTKPVAGAMFAINMLVATNHGGTFTLSELKEDLGNAGFTDVKQIRQDQGMHSVVQARVR